MVSADNDVLFSTIKIIVHRYIMWCSDAVRYVLGCCPVWIGSKEFSHTSSSEGLEGADSSDMPVKVNESDVHAGEGS